VRPAGFEPACCRIGGGRCSVQLRTRGPCRIRTDAGRIESPEGYPLPQETESVGVGLASPRTASPTRSHCGNQTRAVWLRTRWAATTPSDLVLRVRPGRFELPTQPWRGCMMPLHHDHPYCLAAALRARFSSRRYSFFLSRHGSHLHPCLPVRPPPWGTVFRSPDA